jgi:GNAT superfamily N-acetyltransferase
MSWSTTPDATRFLMAAGDFLRSRPADHTTLLTVTDALLARDPDAYGEEDPLLGWWLQEPGIVAGAFLHTPPWPIVLGAVPEPAAPALAGLLAGTDREVSGVTADHGAAEAFAAEWLRLTGAASHVHQRQRLFRLERLTPVLPVPTGRARPATAADRALLLTWYEAFAREVGGPRPEAARAVDDRIGRGGLTLWEVDGEVVAMAGATQPIAGMIRIAPVYTPPRLRRRGYAGAVTAAASQAALDTGVAEVLLFTDLANPTSNALYQRIGYRPVADRLLLSFEPR